MSPRFLAVAVEPWIDPELVFDVLADRHEHVFWLDAGIDAESGWSWLGVGTPEVNVEAPRRAALPNTDPAVWPAGRFRGGWVGWLGYEDGARRAGARTADAADPLPDVLWLRAERWFAFEHSTRQVWAIATPETAASFADEVSDAARSGRAREAESAATESSRTADARHTPAEYATLVEECRELIRQGDAYQLCLTTRFEVTASVDIDGVYRQLRRSSPAHHGGLIRSGRVALASASPERFLEADGAHVRTRPIKGTRPRGDGPANDARLASELLASDKERAENIMIVDLMRNDLSRVCVPGTVNVDALLEIESYPAVHQLVSVVSGRPAAGTTVGDLLDATFPAGSMTGAPKLSAMNHLQELENGPRGVFAGCFGWIGDDGQLDLAMVIRSIVMHPGRAYVGAGGGITWLSAAADEVTEVGIKARAPLAALGAGLPPGW